MNWKEGPAEGFTVAYSSTDGRWVITPAINTDGGDSSILGPDGEIVRWALVDKAQPTPEWIAIGTIEEMKHRAEGEKL